MNVSPSQVIKVFFVLSYVYIVSRLLYKYFQVYTFYMFNEKVVWVKEIEKPRLYIYSLFLPVSLIFCIQALKEEFIGVKVLFFFASVFMIWFCHFTWSEKFKTIFIPKIKKQLFTKSSLITSNIENIDIEKLYNEFLDNNIIIGSMDSFKKMLSQSDIELEERIIWNDKQRNNPKLINRQTLFEFLSQLFHEFENLKNKEIIDFCDKYFCDNKKNNIGLQSKNVTNWRNNKSDYLRKISDLIKACMLD